MNDLKFLLLLKNLCAVFHYAHVHRESHCAPLVPSLRFNLKFSTVSLDKLLTDGKTLILPRVDHFSNLAKFNAHAVVRHGYLHLTYMH